MFMFAKLLIISQNLYKCARNYSYNMRIYYFKGLGSIISLFVDGSAVGTSPQFVYFVSAFSADVFAPAIAEVKEK